MEYLLNISIKILVGIILILLAYILVQISIILLNIKKQIKSILKIIVVTADIVSPIKETLEKPIGQLLINVVAIINSLRNKNK